MVLGKWDGLASGSIQGNADKEQAFTSLRDERQKVAQKIIDMRKAEEDTL